MKRILVTLALALLSVPALFAQMQHDHPKAAKMPDCAAMMEKHEAMQKHAAEMDTKLQGIVDAMNKAKGSAKVDLTAAAVTALVAQRTAMAKQMAEMHPAMMQHMMEHMRSGAMKGMAGSMSGCPMMKAEGPATPHAEKDH